MTFDASRFRFDPRDHYLGVVMQQGRVQLDSDWNDLLAQEVRRIHAGTLDTFGRCVVPRETPDGFLIEADGAGGLTIGPGRAYVHGILAENHGAPPDAWDETLAELRGTAPVAYDEQPYYPDPPPLPAEGRHLLYLDVWQREVTPLQRPELVEPAIGVDTTGRLQTVWQVKVLQGIGAADCDTPDEEVQGWTEATRPSAGRLTTGTADPGTDPDPCLIPPAGGYRGLENQLYRVEIHESGAHEVATFKWSRDNATVATTVTNINAAGDRLVVESVGRDSVLRFSDGDWIEVLDDHRELHNLPGELRRIQVGGGVDDATRTITLEQPVTAGLFPVDAQGNPDPARHTRIRRWDQQGEVLRADGTVFHDLDAVGSTGAIPVPPAGTSLFLEHGIVVRFDLDPGGGEFHVADAWAFAARTATASIEILEQAPPRSIHHHYCRLAVVEFPDDITDCRELWPPDPGGEACCTEVVHPGESIQEALDRLPDTGGCVCLKTGLHEIRETIRITRSNVVLHGESLGAVVRAGGTGVALRIGDPEVDAVVNVSVHDIRFEVVEQGFGIVQIVNAVDVAVHDCELEVTGGAFGAGLLAAECRRLSIARNELVGVAHGLLAEGVVGIEVEDNRFAAPTVNFGPAPAMGGIIGVELRDEVAGTCRVRGNQISDYSTGIYIGRNCERASVTDNRISRRGGVGAPSPGVFQGDTSLPPEIAGALSSDRAFAVVVAASGCVVADNTANLTSPNHGGILVLASHVHLVRNHLTSEAPIGSDRFAVGILLEQTSFGTMEHCLVLDNVLQGFQHGVVLAAEPRMGLLLTAQVRGNRVDGSAVDGGAEGVAGPVGILAVHTSAGLLEANTIVRVPLGVRAFRGQGLRVSKHRIAAVDVGILAEGHVLLAVTGTEIEAARIFGIAGLQLPLAEVAGNTISVGPEGGMPILLQGGAGNRVQANVIASGTFGVGLLAESHPLVGDNSILGGSTVGIAGREILGARFHDNRVDDCAQAGIHVQQSVGRLTIESCTISRTGRSAGSTANGFAILVDRADDVGVRGNVLQGPDSDGGAHWGVLLFLGRRAEVLDNVITSTGLGSSIFLPMTGPGPDSPALLFQELILSGNRCNNETPNPSDNFPPTVAVAAVRLSCVGNQVRAATPAVTSFNFTGTTRLSALGNITSGRWIGVPVGAGLTRPAPVENFNHISVP